MILLKKIQLNNFLSHENTEINFEEGEKILIDGASGAGKSSIFDAIIWALYGQSRADNRSLVRKGSKNGKVVLELRRKEDENTPDTVYVITRSTTQTGKHSIDIAIEKADGTREGLAVAGVRDVQAWIDKDLIGASYLLFINSVAYVQGNAESFVTQSAAKRKELLLEIVKAEDYDKYYENARKGLQNISNEDSNISGQITTLQANLVSKNALLSDKTKLVDTIIEETKKIPDIEDKIKVIEDKKAKYEAVLKTWGMVNTSYKESVKDHDELLASLMSKKEKIKNKKDVNLQVWSDKKDEILRLKTKLTEAGAIDNERRAYFNRKPVIHDYTDQIKRYDDQNAILNQKPVCPSGKDCPYHSGTIDMIQSNINAGLKLALLVKEEHDALSLWKEEEEKIPKEVDMVSILKNISTLEAEVRDIDNSIRVNETIAEIEKEIPAIEAKLVEKTVRMGELMDQMTTVEQDLKVEGYEMMAFPTNTMNAEIGRHRTELEKIKETISRATVSLENIDKAEEEIKETAIKIEDLKRQSSTLQDKARKIALVKDAFGSKGIETLVIDYLLPKLEDRINTVLSQLSDFRVRLDTQKKSADGESTIEGLFITILNEMNEEMSFENYSGGEKLKISVAISESLATLQKVGFRLFDETFIGLDENSTESFATVLHGLNKNFSQVFCISHLLQIKELFDKQLKIVKTNNISYVQRS